MKKLRKLRMLLLAALCALPLCGCTEQSLPRDFYSMKKDVCGVEPVGTIWLGMARDVQIGAVGDLFNNLEIRCHYDQNNTLISMTSIVTYCYPLGISWDMTADQIKAHYAKDPEVTLREDPNLLTFTKTIDGTLYYVRYVMYDDGAIKEINQTTDPTSDPLKFPGKS